MTTPWTHERYLDAVEADIATFVRLAGATDPTVPVPTCPGWTVADLVRHHGRTHRWMRHLVEVRATERIWSADVPVELPDDPAELPAWLAEGAAALVDLLRRTDLDTPLWSWGPDQRVAFYARRVLFEAAVHRADLEFALGRTPRVDAAVAADGIDEFLTNLSSAHWIRHAALDRDATIALTDGEDGWLVTPTADGPRWRRGAGDAVATVHGATGDLLLLCYGRLDCGDDRFRVAGDAAAVRGWLTTVAF